MPAVPRTSNSEHSLIMQSLLVSAVDRRGRWLAQRLTHIGQLGAGVFVLEHAVGAVVGDRPGALYASVNALRLLPGQRPLTERIAAACGDADVLLQVRLLRVTAEQRTDDKR